MPRFDLPTFGLNVTDTGLTVVPTEADRAFVDTRASVHLRGSTEEGRRWLRTLAAGVHHGQVGLRLEARGTSLLATHPVNGRSDLFVALNECTNRRRTPHRWWEVSLDAVDGEGHGKTLDGLTFLDPSTAQGFARTLADGDLLLVIPGRTDGAANRRIR